ncbi:hypothetical protein K437DRAFT_5394 [Tilletiaria anomala UBC 951]|uniref:Uncharacterized protein n=1 Tax=Tilletiaria anomala (strain ATCC 24038 / CBS 436.72 / UBC 951) TaxID=1037660 RepID=A0A066WER6_TILAU|nr:uncharacterized protein K437DRAFT_5394 [Tilletiaria anomala UBC 951]KDN52427.1 hypothetical protein K437DRAFT_5394 [Tilletiaria anomala UBC 951]
MCSKYFTVIAGYSLPTLFIVYTYIQTYIHKYIHVFNMGHPVLKSNGDRTERNMQIKRQKRNREMLTSALFGGPACRTSPGVRLVRLSALAISLVGSFVRTQTTEANMSWVSVAGAGGCPHLTSLLPAFENPQIPVFFKKKNCFGHLSQGILQ